MTLGAARVIWSINDLSIFTDEVVSGYVTMVVKAQRGKVGEARLISSLEEYRRRFGKKVAWTTDPLVVETALNQGARLNLIRTAHYADIEDKTSLTATASELIVYDRGNTPNAATITSEVGPFAFEQQLSGRVIGTEVGPFTFTTDTNDTVSFSVQGGTGCTINITATEGAVTAAVVNAGGTLYKVGDILTIASGTGGKCTVATVTTGGVVATVGTIVGGSGYTTGTGKATTCTGAVQTLTLSGTLTTQQVVDRINAYTTNITATSVYDEGSGLFVVKVAANAIGDSLKVLTISDDSYTLLGFGTPATYAANAGTDSFLISVDGGTDQAFVLDPPGGEEGEFVLSVGQMITRLSGLVGATASSNEGKLVIRSDTYGDDSSLQVKACTAYTTLGFDLTEHVGDSLGTSLATLKITALNEGEWGDSIKIIITESALHPTLYFNVRVVYDLQSDMEEYFADMSMDPASDRYIVNYIDQISFLIVATDLHSPNSAPTNMPAVNETGTYLVGGDDGISASSGYFVGSTIGPFTFVAETSDTLAVTVGSGTEQLIPLVGAAKTIEEVVIQVNATITDATATEYNGRLKIAADDEGDNIILGAVDDDAYTVLGLTAGTYYARDAFEDSDWIGDAAAQTGIYAADTSYMSMDLMVPGTTSVTVYQAMISYCEGRGDMMAYGVTPPGNDPEDTVAWRMGTGSYSHPAFNSHRFSLWFGRPLVYDDRDASRRYIPNLGHLASCLCLTDNSYGSSWAPVGPRRGRVNFVEGIDFNIQDYRSSGYADLFAEYGINYLMINKMPGIEGAMFWEQRTTQRAPSATRELNVMRFITVVNRTLMPILRTFLFEPNHPVIWREIYRVLKPQFDSWKDKYAIYDYAIQCDQDAFFDGGELKNAVLNSGLDIDKGIYRCRALIQPTRAIYYLEFDLGVMRTGESFENYKSLKYLPGWIRK